MSKSKREEPRISEVKPIGEVLSQFKEPSELDGVKSDYSHIELTPQEIEDALNYKRKLKYFALEEEEKRRVTHERINKWKKPFTTEELQAVIMERTEQLPFEFVIDQDNQRVFELLCMYFAGDERFNREVFDYGNGVTSKMSLRKGIGLVSRSKGTGKSVLMKLFQQNKFRPFLQLETKTISSQFQSKGEAVIEHHSQLLHVAPTPVFFFHNDIGICFDDLGFEIPKNNWGSKSDVLADVLFKIYSRCQSYGEFSWFHYTSNLYGVEIEQRYDDRIRDRMREMFNTLVLDGSSRRK